MKNILSAFLALVAIALPLNSYATDEVGDPASTWTYPVIYALDEEVTWYFDMTGTGFDDGQDLYLWAWSPSEPDAGNFDNSSDFAKLEYVGNMVWKKTLTPTKYFSMSVADIAGSAGFWMRLKGKGNEKQSGVINAKWSVAELNDFKTSGNEVQIFPEKFYLDEPLSLLVNANLLWAGGAQGGADGEELHLHAGLNNFDKNAIAEYQAWLPEISEKTKLKNIGDGIYKIDFTPRTYFGLDGVPPVADDYVMENIQFLFPAKDWAKVFAGKDGDYVINAPGAIIPPDPVFYFFPQKFSQYDILTLVRTNNEKNSQGLEYKITAGSKVITGDFSGNMAETRAYVDLLTQLQGAGALSKISLEVKDKNGKEIIKTDIPLVPDSELE
ncbi:hypothetical protein [Dysgonomonas sp. 521]|uniref:hypothetical protein n=1 Tax=Dysgonomonas sp. 521 TaxID=2302932 RepID=UPI0013D5798B|nr:hypothetical protein [Dysgonomonas sp. 521]